MGVDISSLVQHMRCFVWFNITKKKKFAFKDVECKGVSGECWFVVATMVL